MAALTPEELGDTARLVAWLLDLVRRTEDIYLRDGIPPPAAASRLAEELGIDSIGRISLFYAIVDALGADADERAVAAWATVGDVAEFVRRLHGGATAR